MDSYSIPRDDLLDVMEMTQKIEAYISAIIKGNDRNLSMSALMSASINSMIGQCHTWDEVLFFRNLFVQILDGTIRSIQIKPPEKPELS
jgi:hypothetical protein